MATLEPDRLSPSDQRRLDALPASSFTNRALVAQVISATFMFQAEDPGVAVWAVPVTRETMPGGGRLAHGRVALSTNWQTVAAQFPSDTITTDDNGQQLCTVCFDTRLCPSANAVVALLMVSHTSQPYELAYRQGPQGGRAGLQQALTTFQVAGAPPPQNPQDFHVAIEALWARIDPAALSTAMVNWP